MEHIVQFGINIDDEAIKKVLIKNAEEALIHEIKNDVKKAVFHHNYYGQDTGELSRYVQVKINELIESHKDEIIERAATKLAERLSKTKKCREAVDKVLEEV